MWFIQIGLLDFNSEKNVVDIKMFKDVSWDNFQSIKFCSAEFYESAKECQYSILAAEPLNLVSGTPVFLSQ